MQLPVNYLKVGTVLLHAFNSLLKLKTHLVSKKENSKGFQNISLRRYREKDFSLYRNSQMLALGARIIGWRKTMLILR